MTNRKGDMKGQTLFINTKYLQKSIKYTTNE